jgi:hypothetical protein
MGSAESLAAVVGSAHHPHVANAQCFHREDEVALSQIGEVFSRQTTHRRPPIQRISERKHLFDPGWHSHSVSQIMRLRHRHCAAL